MPKITNRNYRKFLDEGIIEILTSEHLALALSNVKGIRGRYVKEGRSLLIALYYTGARPAEILEMEARDVQKEGNYIVIMTKALKRGLPRTLYISQQRKGMKEFYNFTKSVFPAQKIFYPYKADHLRKDNYIETSYRVKYYIKKWFKGVIRGSITPYFLRHNRLSSLSDKGARPAELKYWKGARDIRSVNPYLHLSKRTAKSLAKRVV